METESIVLDQPQVAEKPNTSWDKDFLERHNLLGHVYRRTQNKVYYPYWKSQLNRNSIAKQELEAIGVDLEKENIKVFLLKGFSLMGEIYKDWGERFVSDIDLLVSHDELWKLDDSLRMFGYTKKKEPKWLANRYKHLYTKRVDDIEITIEIHTQLFWHASLDIKNNPEKASVKGFYQLSPENQLIHLCGHLAFQHAFSKLFWLMDAFKYIERYKDKIDWKKFWEQAKQANLYKSCFFTLFLCQKLGLNLQPIFFRAPKKNKVGIHLLKKLVDFSYLYDPQKHKLRMLLVRVLIKDSVFDNIRYGYEWLKTFKKRQTA